MVSVICLCAVSVTAYYKNNGFKDIDKLNSAILKLDSEIEATKKENEFYAKELASLNESDSYVEAIARENLGLVKPGEIVFEFIEQKAGR